MKRVHVGKIIRKSTFQVPNFVYTNVLVREKTRDFARVFLHRVEKKISTLSSLYQSDLRQTDTKQPSSVYTSVLIF